MKFRWGWTGRQAGIPLAWLGFFVGASSAQAKGLTAYGLDMQTIAQRNSASLACHTRWSQPTGEIRVQQGDDHGFAALIDQYARSTPQDRIAFIDRIVGLAHAMHERSFPFFQYLSQKVVESPEFRDAVVKAFIHDQAAYERAWAYSYLRSLSDEAAAALLAHVRIRNNAADREFAIYLCEGRPGQVFADALWAALKDSTPADMPGSNRNGRGPLSDIALNAIFYGTWKGVRSLPDGPTAFEFLALADPARAFDFLAIHKPRPEDYFEAQIDAEATRMRYEASHPGLFPAAWLGVYVKLTRYAAAQADRERFGPLLVTLLEGKPSGLTRDDLISLIAYPDPQVRELAAHLLARAAP